MYIVYTYMQLIMNYKCVFLKEQVDDDDSVGNVYKAKYTNQKVIRLLYRADGKIPASTT